MDLASTDFAVTVIAGVLIMLGLAGVILPSVPGLLLSWLGVLIWAIFASGSSTKWIVFAVISALALFGTIIKYLWPGRRLKQTGVPTRSIVVGVVFAIIGFFVVPIAGLLIGFVLGVFLAELVRLNTAKLAWPSTRAALKAVGFSVMIELFAGLTIAAIWVVGLFVA